MDSTIEFELKKIMGDEYIDTPGCFAQEAEEAGINTEDDVLEWFTANMGSETFLELQDWFDANPEKVHQIMEGL